MPFQKGHKINIGRKCNDATKKRLSLAHLGRKRGNMSEDHKKKIKEALLRNPPNKGKVFSKEWLKKMSESHKGKIPKTHFKKGNIPWNKGLTKKDDRVKKYIEKITGENNYNWKGDNVSYRELHKWIEKQLGNPRRCVFCNTVTAKKYEWANISKKYKRELNDWIRLCTKCHINYDKGYR